MKQIRAQVEDTTSDYDREKLQERLAKIVGGVAVIKVGAATETEMKEKKARVEDAMHATKAAVEEGIVPGGGVALLRGVKALNELKLEGDQQIGVNLVKRAIEDPMRWIANNAGVEGSIVVQKVAESNDEEWGFNAQEERYENLVQAGVIDPAKVVRTALQNASSIASLLLTTEAMVCDIPEEKKESAMPAGGPGGMGGMYLTLKCKVQNAECIVHVADRRGPARFILAGPSLCPSPSSPEPLAPAILAECWNVSASTVGSFAPGPSTTWRIPRS